MVCYDTLVHVPGARAVKDWMIEIKSSATVSGTQKVLVNKHKGQEKWNRLSKVTFASGIVMLRILGDSATFTEIARVVTAKAQTEQGNETISFSKVQVWRWFRKQRGKENSAYLEKTFPTEEKKQERERLATEMEIKAR